MTLTNRKMQLQEQQQQHQNVSNPIQHFFFIETKN